MFSSRKASDFAFFAALTALGGSYVLLMVLLLAANMMATTPGHLREMLTRPEIQYSIRLSILSCTVSALLSLWIGTALGYLLSRYRFPGRWLVEAIVDVPILLPPLVVGLSLLLLFNTKIGDFQLESWLRTHLHWNVTYGIAAVILSQFTVACAFAVRSMRLTFDRINPRSEQVARTLGCSRAQAFWKVVLPQAAPGMSAAVTVAWARSLGEFGPILVFAGATRFRTEVLSTTVFLELSTGSLQSACAASLLMVLIAFVVLALLRVIGAKVDE
jgi:molybdate transport system permease protein